METSRQQNALLVFDEQALGKMRFFYFSALCV